MGIREQKSSKEDSPGNKCNGAVPSSNSLQEAIVSNINSPASEMILIIDGKKIVFKGNLVC